MTRTETWKNTLGSIQLVLGLVLFLMPWLVGFAAQQTPAWTAWVTGVVIAAVGIAALAGRALAATWVNLVIGAWTILAPWLLGFAALSGAMWSHVAIGALLVLAAIAELWVEYQSPTKAHA